MNECQGVRSHIGGMSKCRNTAEVVFGGRYLCSICMDNILKDNPKAKYVPMNEVDPKSVVYGR
jgi:hypothetical protein